MQARRRAMFWDWTADDLAFDARWGMVAKRTGTEIGDVVAFAGQLWSVADRHEGDVKAFDAETLAIAIGISNEGAQAIAQALVDKAIIAGDRFPDWDRRAPAAERPGGRPGRIRCCKTPQDLALNPRWRMMAEDLGARPGVIIALMHCLWSSAGHNRGSIIEFEAKLFAHVFSVPAELIERLLETLGDVGMILDGVLVDWDKLAGGLTPGALRKLRYDRKNQRQRGDSPRSESEPPLVAATRQRSVTTALRTGTAALPPPAPPPKEVELESPLQPPIGGPPSGVAEFRFDGGKILPRVEERRAGRVEPVSASPADFGSAQARHRLGEAGAGHPHGKGSRRSPDPPRRPGPACPDSPATDCARSSGSGVRRPSRGGRPGPADIDAYEPSTETLAWADLHAPEIDVRASENVDAFRDYCRANGKRLRDLDAGFRNWLRWERKFRARAGSPPPRRSMTAAWLDEALAAERGVAG